MHARARTAHLVLRNLCLAALCLACACAARRPGYLEDPSLRPRFGAERYLHAVGVSDRSMDEAELAAKADVSSQVNSSLRAVTGERMAAFVEGVSREESAEYRVQVTTETAFDRAELIRIDAASGYQDETVYYAYAYLDREELDAALVPEYEQEEKVFRSSAPNAQQAYQAGDPLWFAGNYRSAAAAFSRMESLARTLAVARKEPFARHREHERTFLDLIADRLDFENRLRFCLRFDGPESPAGREKIESMFQRFFQRAGLRASQDDCCSHPGPLDYRFEVQARETFHHGMLGPVCSLSLSARVLRCEGEQPVFQFDLFQREPRAAHTYGREQAIRKLYAGLDEEAMYASFRDNMDARFCLEAAPR